MGPDRSVHDYNRYDQMVIDDICYHARCSICDWTSNDYQTRDQAGCEATWHVYENHRSVWNGMFGDNPPRDRDPRKDA